MREFLRKIFIGIPSSMFDSLLDLTCFFLFVSLGATAKMVKEKQKGKKITFAYFLAELAITFFVAFIVWAIFDQFLSFNKFFTFAMCALGGSYSSLFHAKIEVILELFFDEANNYFKRLFKRFL